MCVLLRCTYFLFQFGDEITSRGGGVFTEHTTQTTQSVRCARRPLTYLLTYTYTYLQNRAAARHVPLTVNFPLKNKICKRRDARETFRCANTMARAVRRQSALSTSARQCRTARPAGVTALSSPHLTATCRSREAKLTLQPPPHQHRSHQVERLQHV